MVTSDAISVMSNIPISNDVDKKQDRSITSQTYSHVLTTSTTENYQASENQKIFHLVIPGIDTVREITNILSPKECQGIIEATCSSQEGFTTPTAFLSEARDCQRIHTVDKAMSDIMMKRLRPFLPEIVKIDGVRWKLARFTHHWRYVRYYPGGHFSPHYDGVKMSTVPVPCMSVFTVQIYLNGNESFTGGSTRFYPDYEPDRKSSHEIRYGHVSKFDPHNKKGRRVYSVEAATGKALIFNHALNTLHDGSDVITGKKFIMRGDILYTALPEDIHLLPTVETVCSEHTLTQRHWCPFTALKHGTRNHVGEVWYCVCANDMHGATVDKETKLQACWHVEDGDDDDEVNEDDDEDEKSQSKQVSNITTINLVEDGFALSANPTSTRRHFNVDSTSGDVETTLNRGHMLTGNPSPTKVIVLVSGKRAVGKDFITNAINDALIDHGFTVHRTALGNINKQLYAESVGIDVNRLIRDREFKESHRVAMIQHHTERNKVDPEWCLKQVVNNASKSEVLLLSDIRTLADLEWFKKQTKALVTLRINASETMRKKFGWDPCPIKDKLHTETELDLYHDWTSCWDNNDVTESGTKLLNDWIELTLIPRINDTLL